MDVMFSTPAAVASSIVACRAFTSLTNFRQANVYVQPAPPYRPPPRFGEGPGGVDHVGGGGSDTDSDSGFAKKKRMGGTLAAIAFRSVVAGIDSMSGADDFGAARTTGTLVLDLKPEYPLGGASANDQVIVQKETMVHRHDSEVEFGAAAKSTSHAGGQDSFVSNV